MDRRLNGFTLIELMIVISIVAILASFVMPRFANLVRKSREAATRGNLGALRSAVSLYYSDNEGTVPYILESLTVNGKYLDKIPPAWTVEKGFQITVTNVD